MGITVTRSVASGTVAIDTEGSEDWLLLTAVPSATPPRGLNPVPPSKRLGGGSLLINFDWMNLSGGSPTAFSQATSVTKTAAAADNVQGTAVNTTTAVGYNHATLLDYGFRIRVPADTSVRTVRVYTSHFSGTLTVTARLMDGSVANVVTTHDSGAATQAENKWTITYSTTTVTELVVTFLLTTNLGSTPGMKFGAATLATDTLGAIDNVGPIVVVSSPTTGTAIDDSVPIVLNISDVENSVSSINSVSIRLLGGVLTQIYNGTVWSSGYQAGSLVTNNGNGTFTITVAADGGWNSSIAAVRVVATDNQANQSTTDVGSWFLQSAEIITITASPVTRWEAIVARVRLDDTLMIVYEGVNNRFTIYDGTKALADRWNEFFNQRSSVATSSGDYLITVLPNGGWWASSFTIKFIPSRVGVEAGYVLE